MRARQALIALGVAAAVYAAVLVSDVLILPLLDDDGDIDALETYDAVTAIAGLVELLTFVVTATFFIRWFNAAHRSLDGLCPGARRHKTWWSIGGWFIPIMFLFRPKQILDDMIGCANEARGQPWWAPTWWALWLLGSIGGQIVGRLFIGADTLEDLETATIVDAVVSAILVAAAGAAIVVVRRLTDLMESKRRAVEAQAPAPAGPV